MAFAYYEPMAG